MSEKNMRHIAIFYCRFHRLTALNPSRSLTVDLPFSDVLVSVSLDDLLPRVLHLCKESADRKTRVAACEALNSIVLMIIGR